MQTVNWDNLLLGIGLFVIVIGMPIMMVLDIKRKRKTKGPPYGLIISILAIIVIVFSSFYGDAIWETRNDIQKLGETDAQNP